MGFHTRLSPKQSCVVCSEASESCVCLACESSFTNHQPRCLSCAHPITTQLNFCGQCLAHSPAFNRAYTLFDYQATVKNLIQQFKFDRQLCVGDFFAKKLYQTYRSMPKYDAIIPMPLSRDRIQQRGFNQVLELLRVIRQKTDTTIDINSVKRIKSTQPLSLLNAEQRKQEIKGAFQVVPMPYKTVLLVDDVMTTGSSLNELATTILQQANIESCDVLTLARAESKV